MNSDDIYDEIRNLRNWVIVDLLFTAALAGEKAIEIITLILG